jgi:hypothetical protein
MLTVVWAYRRTGKFAFHVLTGALETDERTAGVPIEFANGVDAVVAAITAALAGSHARVLVGWSFYSPDAAAMTAELRAVKLRVDDPRVLHVCGGVHAAAESEATLCGASGDRGEPAVAAAGWSGGILAEEALEGRHDQRGARAAGADRAVGRAGATAAAASGDVSRRAGASGGDPAVGGAASRSGGRRRLPARSCGSGRRQTSPRE